MRWNPSTHRWIRRDSGLGGRNFSSSRMKKCLGFCAHTAQALPLWNEMGQVIWIHSPVRLNILGTWSKINTALLWYFTYIGNWNSGFALVRFKYTEEEWIPQPGPKCRGLLKGQQHAVVGYSVGRFCLCGKCQGVIDISHWALYLCAMFQVLWSGLTLTFTSALFSSAFLGGALLKIAQWAFDGVSFIWDNLPFLLLPAASLTVPIYFETQLFSVLFDLRFTPGALSAEVWKKPFFFSAVPDEMRGCYCPWQTCPIVTFATGGSVLCFQ